MAFIVKPIIIYKTKQTESGNWAIVRVIERNFSTDELVIGYEKDETTARMVAQDFQDSVHQY